MMGAMISSDSPSRGWRAWVARQRRDILDLSALALSFAAILPFVPALPAAGAVCALVVAALVPLRPARAAPGPWNEFKAALPRRCAAVLVTAGLLRYVLNQSLSPLLFGVAWPLAAWILALDWPRFARWLWDLLEAARARASRRLEANRPAIVRWVSDPTLGEALRSTLLLVASLWLMRGFQRPTLHGTGDAYWYGLNLADMVAQVRAGVFPVWVGQSLFQFNGAICPVRVAPLFHYLGALLDAVTLHSLGTFALQNLLITLIGVCAMFSAYLALRRLLPRARWLAGALAVLYLASPGTLGLAYNTDLYMSWTTVPLVPLAWFATVRSFDDRGAPGTLILLGASLGLSWWGHSPIALWLTLITGAIQLARIARDARAGLRWGPLLAGALAFGLIAAYPVGSLLFYPTEPGGHSNLFQRPLAGVVVEFLRSAFPAAYLPVSPRGRIISDFQLGYSLWALLVFLVWSQRRAFRPAAAAPLAGALLLALFLLPLPGINAALWAAVPGFVLNPTGNWAMSRLCLPLSAATVFSAAAYLSQEGAWPAWRRRVAAFAVASACAWSLREAAKFAHGSLQSIPPQDSAVDLLRPEGIQITRYSYSMFPEFPSTFTHGVADPYLENHLLARGSLAPLEENAKAAVALGRLEAAGEFLWNSSPGSPVAVLDRTFRIEPGRFYVLKFDFADPEDTHGLLQISGAHLFREYALPEYGGSRAFGSGGAHADALSVYTTAGPQDLTLRFIPAKPPEGGAAPPPVARVSQLSYAREALPVSVSSWIPYRALVRSPAEAWLETPRAFQTGYTATVDGKPAAVRRSPDAQVCVAVPQGVSRVELAYEAPRGLRLLFGLSALSIVGAAALGAARWILHLRGGSPPAKAS
jgi:hypothetical protein